MNDKTLAGDPPPEPDEDQLARALRCPPLPADALARVRVSVEAEWRGLTSAPRRRSRWTLAAAASSLAALVGVVWWAATDHVPGVIVGQVASLEPAALMLQRRWLPDVALSTGSTIPVGSVLQAARTSTVAIAGGGRLLIEQGSRLLVSEAHEVNLLSGAVYVDFDPEAAHGRLDVRTTFGVVRHVGTQFEVALLSGAMRVRVREGVVRIDGPVTSQGVAGQEIQFAAGVLPRYTRFEPTDAAWTWVQVASAQRLENRSVMSFLRWVARETGCKLQFADEQSRSLAEHTVLRGSMRAMPAETAMRAVLGTTSLTASVDHGTIFVQRAAAGPPTDL